LDPTTITPTRTTTNNIPTEDYSLSRIFILLLSPESKQFYLMQIQASMVPALGDRPYVGLCHPIAKEESSCTLGKEK
jgi:hypothetical protein